MIEKQRMVSGLLALALLAFLSLSFWQAHAQGLGNDRLGMQQFLRQIVGQPQHTYIADTTLDRFLNYAHRTTKLALGVATGEDVDTIVTSSNILTYSLNAAIPIDTSTNAVTGRVTAVKLRHAEVVGHGEEFLRYVPPEMLGQTGDAPPGAAYSVIGDELALSKSPNGDDTLFVYHSTVSDDLSADDTALQIAEEDETAVVLLACAWVAFSEGDLQRGQLFYTMWKDHLSVKGVKFPVEEPVVR